MFRIFIANLNMICLNEISKIILDIIDIVDIKLISLYEYIMNTANYKKLYK
ncbi:hypothetical protein UT300005_10310 [Clostridium sp. CTA-5]